MSERLGVREAESIQVARRARGTRVAIIATRVALRGEPFPRPLGRHPTYTIADVVRIAQVTERTVRRDIASGRLPSVKLPNGRRRFRLADINKYRCSRALQKPHIKLQEFARLFDINVRTFRRYLASGRFSLQIIRASARRHYVSRSVLAKWAKDYGGIEALEQDALARERAARQGRATPRPSLAESTRSYSGPPWFLTVAEVADLAQRTVRQVHHDIEISATRTDAGGPPDTRGRDAAIGLEVPQATGF